MGLQCIEVVDKAFGSSREKILDSIGISKRYMDQVMICFSGAASEMGQPLVYKKE